MRKLARWVGFEMPRVMVAVVGWVQRHPGAVHNRLVHEVVNGFVEPYSKMLRSGK